MFSFLPGALPQATVKVAFGQNLGTQVYQARKKAAFSKGAGQAVFLAQLYVEGLLSFNAGADLIVTAADVTTNGLQPGQALAALPFVPVGVTKAAGTQAGGQLLGVATEATEVAIQVADKPLRLTAEKLNELAKALGSKFDDFLGRIRKADSVEEAERLVDDALGIAPNTGLRGTAFSQNVRSYIDAIERHTGFRLHSSQRTRLADNLRTNSYSRLSTEAGETHRRLFTQRVKNAQIAEWERQTGQAWPRYAQDLVNAEGKVLRKAGDPFDAHRVWSLWCARFPMNFGPSAVESHVSRG